MARRKCHVLLGFEEEKVTEKNKCLVDFTSSKIGGKPDWPFKGAPDVYCRVCGLYLPLVLQIYAPLENSPYHRTLYLFGCVNPKCWNRSESWVCLRSQVLDETSRSTVLPLPPLTGDEWCDRSAQWGDDSEDDDDGQRGMDGDEENGNIIMGMGRQIQAEIPEKEGVEEDDDDDDIEEEEEAMEMGGLEMGVHNLSVDDPNANSNARGGVAIEGIGAVGQLRSPVATAEIEVGDEGEVVCIDTPKAAQMDILALFAGASETSGQRERCENDDDEYEDEEEVSERRQGRVHPCDFEAYFLTVWPEDDGDPSSWARRGDEELGRGYGGWNPLALQGAAEGLGEEEDHIRQLLLEYRQNSGEDLPPACAGRIQKALMGCCWGEQPNMGAAAVGMKGGGAMVDEGSTGEKYERGVPAHGDRMFHHFLIKIKKNPGQLVRYCRDAGSPLLLYPLCGNPQASKCLHCRGETIFELQVLPSLIPKLRPTGVGEECPKPEFGTVLVFACAKSCWGTGGDEWREERVIVQAEQGP
ncbi:programmed cell death protein 2-like [Hetaerina americana]|uniref:programmed cell death protein 2-like n=1 Tax=Hetaerina americana TaxID=62018 RepID=UPI003A7F13E1